MISIKSMKGYCCEDISKIENYDKAVNDKTQMWQCHHRLEITEEGIFSHKELKEKGLYYQRPALELIFLTESEHKHLHDKNRRIETRVKLSENLKKRWESGNKDEMLKNSLLKGGHSWIKGKPSPMRGTKKSPETIQKMKDAKKEWWKNHIITEEERKRRSEGAKKALEKNINKLKEYGKKYREMYKGKHWKLVNGKRVWILD